MVSFAKSFIKKKKTRFFCFVKKDRKERKAGIIESNFLEEQPE